MGAAILTQKSSSLHCSCTHALKSYQIWPGYSLHLKIHRSSKVISFILPNQILKD